jgi:transcriptional regulator with XRE-family HTH domain
MTTQFALDLRLQRRKACYTQRDIAHLMGVQQSAVSDLERGRHLPDLEEIITLSLIYGRSFESLFAQLMHEAREELKKRLASIPQNVRQYAGTLSREHSLKWLNRSLEAEDHDHGT